MRHAAAAFCRCAACVPRDPSDVYYIARCRGVWRVFARAYNRIEEHHHQPTTSRTAHARRTGRHSCLRLWVQGKRTTMTTETFCASVTKEYNSVCVVLTKASVRRVLAKAGKQNSYIAAHQILSICAVCVQHKSLCTFTHKCCMQIECEPTATNICPHQRQRQQQHVHTHALTKCVCVFFVCSLATRRISVAVALPGHSAL